MFSGGTMSQLGGEADEMLMTEANWPTPLLPTKCILVHVFSSELTKYYSSLINGKGHGCEITLILQVMIGIKARFFSRNVCIFLMSAQVSVLHFALKSYAYARGCKFRVNARRPIGVNPFLLQRILNDN